MRKWIRRVFVAYIVIGWLGLGYFVFWHLVPLDPEIPRVRDEISVPALEKRWGKTPFEASSFKTGDVAVRASMAADAVTRQVLLGFLHQQVVAKLGASDWAPDYDPTYLLKPDRPAWRDNTIYHLRFEIDPSSKRVSRVYVVRECCQSPRATYWYKKGWFTLD